MNMKASRRKTLKWHLPKEDKGVRRLMLGMFIILFGFQVCMGIHVLSRDVRSNLGEFVSLQVLLTLFTLMSLGGYIVSVRLDRLTARSYTFYWRGGFDEVLSKVRRVLDDIDVRHETDEGFWGRPLFHRLLDYEMVIYQVPSEGFRVYIDHEPRNEEDDTGDLTTIHVGPVTPRTNAVIFSFIEIFNDLFEDDERPNLIVWGRKAGRQPANTGEGFNTSLALTSNAREDQPDDGEGPLPEESK